MMLVRSTRSKNCCRLPAVFPDARSFHSDLFALGYAAVGQLDPGSEVLADWSGPCRKGVIYYLSDRRVRGVLLWNVWQRLDAARALIAASGPFDANSLARRL